MFNMPRIKIGLLVATLGIASLACGALPILEGIVSDLPTPTLEHHVSLVEPFSIWYVSTVGDDLADCTTPATACATVGAALRKASSGDWIEIAAGTYVESDRTIPSVAILIDKPILIYGDGSDSTFLDGAGLRTVIMNTSDGRVTVQDLTIQNGGVGGGGLGGGIRNVSETSDVLLSDVVVQNNLAGEEGGGVWNAGQMLLENVIVRNNQTTVNHGSSGGSGGGIYNGITGDLTLQNAQVLNNNAGGVDAWDRHPSAGILNSHGQLLIDESIIKDNQGTGIVTTGTTQVYRSLIANNDGSGFAHIYGGGVKGDAVTIENVTVSGNFWYGIVSYDFTTITYSTIVNNSTGIAGVRLLISTVANSIVAGNSVEDCAGTRPTLVGHNLFSEDDCLGTTAPFHEMGVDVLADNGGPTQTHALLPGSPALDFAIGEDCPLTDQRSTGFPRPIGSACDVGAYEGVIPGVVTSNEEPGNKLIITTDTPCYTGPGIDWTLVNVLDKDTVLELIGLGNTGDQQWIVAKHPSIDNITCWLDLNKADPDIPPDEMRLIVVPPRPEGPPPPIKEPREADPPTPEPPACNPKQQQCP